MRARDTNTPATGDQPNIDARRCQFSSANTSWVDQGPTRPSQWGALGETEGLANHLWQRLVCKIRRFVSRETRVAADNFTTVGCVLAANTAEDRVHLDH